MVRDKNNIIMSDFEAFNTLCTETVKDSTETEYALVCVDISNFDFITKSFGATAGNSMIELVTKTVSVNLSVKAVLRFSAENILVFMEFPGKEGMIEFIDSSIASVRESSIARKYSINADLIFGIHTIGEKNRDDDISDISDKLVATIEHSGKISGYFYYDEASYAALTRELEIVHSVDDAMKNGEFHIFLQPQHYLQYEDRVLSAEALIRWIKKDGRVISPGEFIPVFEKNGLITKLDCHVMELACQFISKHLGEPWFEEIVISVNVSKVDLRLSDFIEYYTNMRKKYNIPDGRIEIEFTESAVFEDYSAFKEIMFQLRKNGFYCSIDDFGTGSSSLNMLKSMPVDVLKMDRMFFVCDNDGTENKDRDNSVIASVVAMARGLGMKIVAEGIESPERIDFLRKIGCDVIQGFVYSKPLSVTEFERYVKNYIPKYLPISQRIHPVPPARFDTFSDAQAVYEKYTQMLPYVNAVVIELDIESDSYSIISYGQNKVLISEPEGSYSSLFDNSVIPNVHPDFTSDAIRKISLKGILAAFYRGDSETDFEMKMKLYDADEYDAEGEYTWCRYHIFFRKINKNSGPSATIFLSDIQEEKERELSVKSAEHRLKSAIRTMKCDIYEINLKEDKMYLLHTGNKSSELAGKVMDFSSSIRRWVHENDKERLSKFLDAVSGEKKPKGFYTECRISGADGIMRWKSVHISSEPDGRTIAIMQDITDYKTLKEKAEKSERTLYQFVSAMCICVFEINFSEKNIHILKADGEFEGMSQTVSDITQYNNFIKEMNSIHPVDADKFAYMMSVSNLRVKSEEIVSSFLEYRVISGGSYRWHELRIIRSNDSTMIFISDIDERKITELRRERDSRRDNITMAYNTADFKDFVQEFIEREGHTGNHLMCAIKINNFDRLKREKGIKYTNELQGIFAATLKKCIRKDDVMGKDDEGKFIFLLRDIDLENASRFSEKVRIVFEKQNFEDDTLLDFSMGMAALSNGNKSVESLMTQAAHALNQADKNGKGYSIFSI